MDRSVGSWVVGRSVGWSAGRKQDRPIASSSMVDERERTKGTRGRHIKKKHYFCLLLLLTLSLDCSFVVHYIVRSCVHLFFHSWRSLDCSFVRVRCFVHFVCSPVRSFVHSFIHDFIHEFDRFFFFLFFVGIK